MGRPRKYTDLERKLLNKCKHPYVQNFLKKKIFGNTYMECIRYMDMVSLWIADAPNQEYNAIWLNIYRYLRKCERFKHENIKHWYPDVNFKEKKTRKKRSFDNDDGYDSDARWKYEHEHQQE